MSLYSGSCTRVGVQAELPAPALQRPNSATNHHVLHQPLHKVCMQHLLGHGRAARHVDQRGDGVARHVLRDSAAQPSSSQCLPFGASRTVTSPTRRASRGTMSVPCSSSRVSSAPVSSSTWRTAALRTSTRGLLTNPKSSSSSEAMSAVPAVNGDAECGCKWARAAVDGCASVRDLCSAGCALRMQPYTPPRDLHKHFNAHCIGAT